MSGAHVTRLLLIPGLLGAQLLLFAGAASAQGFGTQEIDSNGPLTQIIISNDLSCQVEHAGDVDYELYGGEIGSCGTFLATAGNVFGPASGNATTTPYTPQAQTPVSGSGSSSDPLRIVTTADASQAGIRVQQTDSYVVGSQSYRTDVQLTNGGQSTVNGILYRYGDCFLQNFDTGYGRVDNGAPACIVDPSLGQRIEQWRPLTDGSHYFEGFYGDGYGLISQQVQFPDTCICDQLVDNGAGLSWPVSIAPGESVTFSQETYFSPTGLAPVTQSYASSVPDPTQITLDPVAVAESAVITAGVVLLVPFPSALFNSTLEDNYDAVMAGADSIRRRLRGWWLRFVGWLRGEISRRRQPLPTPTPTPPPSAPPPTATVDPTHPLGGPLPGAVQPIAPMPPGPELALRATAIVEASVPGQPPPPPMAEAVPVRDVWRTPLGILGFVCLSALFYCFLDPTFGLSVTSLGTLVGLALGLMVILVAYGLPLVVLSRNHHIGLTIRALPASLIIAVVCVLVSRLANFQPGYLYGLVVGFFYAHEVSRQFEGKTEALAAGASLTVAFVAWILLAFVRGGAGGADPFINALLQSAMVTVVVAGIENAVFAMLPMRFLPGAAVYGWNRIVWVVLLGLGVFGFAHVLLNPASNAGYLADTTRTPFFTLVALLVLFGVASVAFWAWFRFRPSPEHEEAL